LDKADVCKYSNFGFTCSTASLLLDCRNRFPFALEQLLPEVVVVVAAGRDHRRQIVGSEIKVEHVPLDLY
jgi:hypothetical protein